MDRPAGKARVKLVLPGLRVCEVQPERSTVVRTMAITIVIPGAGRWLRIRPQDGAGRGQCKGATFHQRGTIQGSWEICRPGLTGRGESSSDQIPGGRWNGAGSFAKAGSFFRRWSCSGENRAARLKRKQAMSGSWVRIFTPAGKMRGLCSCYQSDCA